MNDDEDAPIDAEQVIGSVINGSPIPASEVHGDEEEVVILDEADEEMAELEEGMTIQDIDEIEEIKEEA